MSAKEQRFTVRIVDTHHFGPRLAVADSSPPPPSSWSETWFDLPVQVSLSDDGLVVHGVDQSKHYDGDGITGLLLDLEALRVYRLHTTRHLASLWKEQA